MISPEDMDLIQVIDEPEGSGRARFSSITKHAASSLRKRSASGSFICNSVPEQWQSFLLVNYLEDLQLPKIDEEGYLIDPHDWNEELAKEFALKENIQLTEDHWDAIRFMRDYYAENQIAPDVRHVMKHLAKRLGLIRATRCSSCFPTVT